MGIAQHYFINEHSYVECVVDSEAVFLKHEGWAVRGRERRRDQKRQFWDLLAIQSICNCLDHWTTMGSPSSCSIGLSWHK